MTLERIEELKQRADLWYWGRVQIDAQEAIEILELAKAQIREQSKTQATNHEHD